MYQDRIVQINIEEEMKTAYIDYSMSVIVSRALPDVRDGLKPVQRRVIYGMDSLGLVHNRPHKKSARIVGEVLGKFHPHGDSSVYDAMVRMAQEWSLRYPLVDGQGNFGSVDGDSPAAMRYCVVGNTRIKTNNGLSKIQNLVANSELNSDNDLIAKVLSIHKTVNSTSKLFNSGVHKIWKLLTAEGFEVEGTANHPVLIFTKDETGKPIYAWKLLKDVKTGDRIVIDRSQTNLNEKALTETEKNWAIIAGCLISEGSVTNGRITFNNTDSLYYQHFINAYSQNIGSSFYSYQRELPTGKTIYEFDVQNIAQFEQNNPLFQDLYNLKSAEKCVPDYIFSASREVQKIFLQYLFEGDGSVSLLGKNTINLQYSTRSLQLAKDVQLLLLEFGVLAKISKQNRSDEYKLCIGNFHNIQKFHENVGFATQKVEKLNKIMETETLRRQQEPTRNTLSKDYIPYIAEYLRKALGYNELLTKKNIDRYERIEQYAEQILEQIQDEKLQHLFQELVADNYYFATVTSCEQQAQEQTVFSVKVQSKCHSFVANGFVNHNTEARLTRLAEEMIGDLEKDTVDYQLNFDDSLEEPTVMPSKVPNLLINGASGIAVGMATNMLPHNLGEIIDATIAYIDDRDITIAELCKYVLAPDFPTGGIIYGVDGVRQAFETGRGKVVVRGKAEIEAIDTLRDRIVITEIPYQINKSVLVKKIADLVNEKKIEGISDLRDESDRNGMRIVCDLRRDANSSVILNQLYNFTSLQTSFGVNNVCLVKGRPRLLNLKQLIAYFVEFRHEVVTRRCEFELRKARERAHVLEGFLIALDHLDAVIELIRSSSTPDIARDGLMSNFGLSEIQSREILNMRLQRLTGLERDKIRQEYDEIMKRVNWLLSVLGDEVLRMGIIKEELNDIKARYADGRRTRIEYAAGDISITDIIDNEHVALTISHLGYIKRTSLDEYREQGRGGKGSRGGATRSDDFIEHLFVGSTHDYLLIFTELGKCYWLRVYDVPEGTKTSKGRAIQNLINIDKEDNVRAYLTVETLDDPAFLQSHYIVFATKNGTIKKTPLEDYSRPRAGGIRALSIAEGDRLLEVRLTNGSCDILLGVRSGRAVRFPESKVRPMGRTATGVNGITLSEDEPDEVVGMVCIDPNDTQKTVLSVSERGFGKRTPLSEYRLTNRGGKGVTTLNVTEKVGHLIAIKQVTDEEGLMIICKSGIAIRLLISKISTQGRNTQGSRLISLSADDSIASIEVVPRSEEEEVTLTEIDNAEGHAVIVVPESTTETNNE